MNLKTRQLRDQAIKLRVQGKTLRAIAEELGHSYQYVHQLLRKAGLKAVYVREEK